MKRTFLDSGVLIAAARGDGSSIALSAFQIIDDPNREFVTSEFVRLEVLPKPIYLNNADEAEFYEIFFDSVRNWVPVNGALMSKAFFIAKKFGLSAVDALNISAALLDGSDEFITSEKATKPMHRVTEINVISIHPD